MALHPMRAYQILGQRRPWTPLRRQSLSLARAWGRHRPGGFGMTLLELLLALVVAMGLFMVIVQALLHHDRGSERLGRLLRERGVQRRTLALLRSEVLRAERLELAGGGQALVPQCSLAGRRAVLQLATAHGTITYSLGSPPSAIWRGQVLMRCGPAYGLDGEPSPGVAQNRVLLDGLAQGGFEAIRREATRVQLRLRQRFHLRDGNTQEISSALEIATAELMP